MIACDTQRTIEVSGERLQLPEVPYDKGPTVQRGYRKQPLCRQPNMSAGGLAV
jgi:hypothetical protein